MRLKITNTCLTVCVVVLGWLVFGCQELQQNQVGGENLSGQSGPALVHALQSLARDLEGVENSLTGIIPDQEAEKYHHILAVEYLRRARFTCIYVSQNLETLPMLRAEELSAYGQAKIKQIQAWQRALEGSVADLQLIYLELVDDGARYQLDKADDILKTARGRLEEAQSIMSELSAS